MDNNSSGYGKRPLWQWIAIYLGIAAVVYGLIYYVAFGKTGTRYNTSAPSGIPQQQNPSYPSY